MTGGNHTAPLVDSSVPHITCQTATGPKFGVNFFLVSDDPQQLARVHT